MDLEAAVKQYSRMLYRICIVILGSEEDTQDAVQDTFCKYLEKKPEFADAEHEKAWLIKVATNHCRDIQRFRFRHPRVPIEELAGTLVPQQEDREAIRELLHMPPKAEGRDGSPLCRRVSGKRDCWYPGDYGACGQKKAAAGKGAVSDDLEGGIWHRRQPACW